MKRVGLLASTGHHLDSFFVDMAPYLESQGFQVFFAAGTPMERARSTVLSAVTRRPSPRNFRASAQLRNWVSSNGLDLVLTNTATASLLARASIRSVPVVYFAHGLHWDDPRSLRARPWVAAEKLVMKRTSAAIVLNDEDEAWFRSQSPKMPLLRLKWGVGVPVSRFPRSPRTSDAPVVVWIGEHSRRKRPLLALDVFAEFANARPDAKLLMLGRGPLTGKIRDAIKERRLEDSVLLPGHVSPASHIRDAACLLHTASWEGLPRVVLESLCVGRPVAAFSVKGVRNLPGVHTVSDEDTTALANVLGQLIDSDGTDGDYPCVSELSIESAAMNMATFLRTALAP